MTKKTLLLSHPSLLNHGKADHPENSSRLTHILSGIESSGHADHLDLTIKRPATREEIEQVHTKDYVSTVFALDGVTADLDPETPLTPGSVPAARLAAGLGIELVERVLSGQVQNGFALVRPPGHHARPGAGMGFCIFNNIAIAAKKSQSLGLSKILILDWDVHHGNGTQEIFYEDDRVLFIDLHQDDLFPQASGLLEEVGKNQGLGTTVNIPLPHSCRDLDYLYIFDTLVRPLATRYQPELILVSAGFDAHERDPLGSMSISSAGFGELTLRTRALADELCGGKCILFLEGGYAPQDLTQNVLQCIEALTQEPPIPPNAPIQPYTDEIKTLVQGIYETHPQFTS